MKFFLKFKSKYGSFILLFLAIAFLFVPNYNFQRCAEAGPPEKTAGEPVAESKLAKLPRCKLSSLTGPARDSALPCAEEIRDLLESPKNSAIEKYRDKCKKKSTNFYDYFIIEKPRLIIFYDYESDRADWVKCEWLKELPQYRNGSDFSAIARSISRSFMKSISRKNKRGLLSSEQI
ncbi:MAG TPA: hypothetical protein PKW98_01745 [Candidatus Wallbacteria bacterium]|nr:MAG: hypothetical protein BWY32_00864 [bacterium ADurb.Bin243]HOD40315.1 hypothetical protein [Candidatus Wallbacteria bacterium]HPG56515.1 hypothetical protein [Candidatus Wallbacteria bacterium]